MRSALLQQARLWLGPQLLLILAVVAAAVLIPIRSAGGATGTVYVSPSGSDANPCTQAAPCRSLDRGYRVAAPGQTVELAGGSYPGQDIRRDPAKDGSSEFVVFRPAAGATVTMAGDLALLGARRVELRGLKGESFDVLPSTRSELTASTVYADTVVLRQLDAKTFYFRGAGNVSLLDSTVGNYSYTQGYGSNTIGSYAGMPPSRNVLLDGVDFRNIRRDSSPNHAECLFLQNVDGITIRNSTFDRCPVMGIFAQAVGGPLNPRNVVIENNWIGLPGDNGSSSIYVDDRGGTPAANWLIRHNSLGGGLRFLANGRYQNMVAEANVGPNDRGYCVSSVTYRFNVWTGVQCGPTDRVGELGYVDEAGFDFHLRPGAPAIDAGNRSSYPVRDIDGDLRYTGSAPDAGADEVSGAEPPPPPPPPSDTTAPTAPSGLRVAESATDAIALSWAASSDDVGVEGYGLYRNGGDAGSTAATAYRFTGLSCGTSYAVAVDAFDRAGNRSGRASVTASTAACAPPPPPPPPPKPVRLVGAFSFDEGAGTTAGDASGNGNAGTIRGAVWAPGKTGTALLFDGLDDWVTVAASPSLAFANGITLEGWFRPILGTGSRTAIAQEAPAGLAFALSSANGNGRPSAAAGETRADGPEPMPLAAWTHLALTFDGVRVRLFVDGIEVADAAATSVGAASGTLRIGGNGARAGEFFQGLADDVRIYDGALTAEQIRRDLAAPVTPAPPAAALP